jgi:DNA-binding CsgD family transcriptional regulator
VLDHLEAADLRAQIWNLMRGLPGRQREVCYLRLFEQLEFATIAVRLGIAEKTARSHWSLVMQRLVQELALLRSAPGTGDDALPEPERPGGARVLPLVQRTATGPVGRSSKNEPGSSD